MWYTRREVMKRVAFFYLFGNSVGGFGGILAYGLQQMAGVANHPGWAWMFVSLFVNTFGEAKAPADPRNFLLDSFGKAY